MIIVHLSGGFGNQLFSYAFGYALAKKRKEPLFIDTAIQDADWFFRNPDIMNMNIQFAKRISYPIGRSIQDRVLLNRIRFHHAIGWKTKEVLEQPEDKMKYKKEYTEVAAKSVYMRGDWQNESYFSDVKEELIGMFTFDKALSEGARMIEEEMQSMQGSVAIHCRRGDYVKLGISLPSGYYKEAMETADKLIENPVFYCFSDDPGWAKEQFNQFPFDIRYPEYLSSEKGIEDFRLISAAKHQIVSNSTYSWWAAYLNRNEEKKVICPIIGMWQETFWPKGWIKLRAE